MGRLLRGKGYTTVVSFDRGQQITLDLDDWIAYQIFLTGFYDVETNHTRFFRRLVREGMVVIDVGAHIGYYTLQAAVRVGERGQVHAFEPVSYSFSRLTENIRVNGLANVSAHRCVVRDRAGIADVHVADAWNRGASGFTPPENVSGLVERVPAVTLDEYAKSAGLAAVDLVKIDVEGAEMAVLKGMSRLLEQPRLQLLIEVKEGHLKSQGSSPEELLNYLSRAGFLPWKITRRGIDPLSAPVTKESLALFRRADP